MPQDPMAMGRAMQAIMAQAAAWVAQYKSDLTARGLGFTPDDLAAITASASAHPWPPGGAASSQADVAEMQHAQQMAMETVYPETGFATDDPRLLPNGMPLVAYAVAARAIGWANDDTTLVDRVVTALGHSHDDYVDAGEHWTAL
ncbi:MAG TPA: hypothetical protein VFI19_13550, partial [Nocardioides sp.]|nr:hypothetical protein [Nocardioides sp.]